MLDEHFKPVGYNVGTNVGAVARQTIADLHVHPIPRYPGDVADSRNGVRGVIPDKQKYRGENDAGFVSSLLCAASPAVAWRAAVGLAAPYGDRMKIRGGSAFHAMAGFGHHHRMHEDRFFELGGSLIVEVEFIVSAEEKKRLLELIAAEKIRLFYADIPATFGILNPDRDDPVSNNGVPS